MLKRICFLSITLMLFHTTTFVVAASKNSAKKTYTKSAQKAARHKKRLLASDPELRNKQVPLRRDFDTAQTDNSQDYFTGR